MKVNFSILIEEKNYMTKILENFVALEKSIKINNNNKKINKYY